MKTNARELALIFFFKSVKCQISYCITLPFILSALQHKFNRPQHLQKASLISHIEFSRAGKSNIWVIKVRNYGLTSSEARLLLSFSKVRVGVEVRFQGCRSVHGLTPAFPLDQVGNSALCHCCGLCHMIFHHLGNTYKIMIGHYSTARHYIWSYTHSLSVQVSMWKCSKMICFTHHAGRILLMQQFPGWWELFLI